MKACECHAVHDGRRIVLTGGPGAGKTALLELLRQSFCSHVRILPEAAGMLFAGGFPRGQSITALKATQRAIYTVQRELETIGEEDPAAMVVCDRGTVDGGAFWPLDAGDSLWESVGTTLGDELSRYHAVIHLRTPSPGSGLYSSANPVRIETAAEAFAIDHRIATLWASHPRRFVVEATPDFLEKASRAVAILRQEIPACCRNHVRPATRFASLPPAATVPARVRTAG